MTYIKRVNPETYDAAGTIAPDRNVIELRGSGVLAMTLPAPVQHGATMFIVSTTANAHTVTYAAGFNGGGAGADVATFGGAAGDSLMLIALGGVWYVMNATNVTLA